MDFIRRHSTQALLTVLGLSGIGAVFLPFVDIYVPLGVLLDPPFDSLFFSILVGPFVVLPFFIFAGYSRWLLSGDLSRWENGVGYALALIGALALPAYIVGDTSGKLSERDWLGVLCLFVVYAANAWLITQSRGGGRPPIPPALAAMQVVYLVFALFWLTRPIADKMLDDAGSAAYLAAFTVLVYTVQVAFLVRGGRRKLLGLVPLALLWGLWPLETLMLI